jgi:DNA-binding transcriptional LysR family regulator
MASIRDMELLVALARQKHFSRAAEECGISQPAFSARIRNIEEQFGLPIVRRGNKFLGFTHEGELLLKWARRILSDVEGMRQELDISQGNLRGSLTLGVVPTTLSFVAQVSARLRETHPDLVVNIQSLTSNQISVGLNDYSLDAGITYMDRFSNDSARIEPLYEESYVLIVPKHLAPRLKGEATWQEAAMLPLCLLNTDMRNRQLIDEAFASIGTRPQPVTETDGFTVALALVVGGTAATIAPQRLAESIFSGEDTIQLDLTSPVLTHSIGLAVLTQDPVLPAIRALQSAVQKAL